MLQIVPLAALCIAQLLLLFCVVYVLFMGWPKLDTVIEETVRSCSVCQLVQHTPPVSVLHPSSWPDRPFQQVHLDFAGSIFRTDVFRPSR